MQGQIKLLKHSKLTLSLVLGLLATSSSAWADQTDTYNRRLKGNYGFAATGYFGANFDSTSQTTTGAVAERVGVYSFDGKGNCKIHSLANKAGLAEGVIQDSTECLYQIDKDGTGQVDATLGGKTFNTFFVLVSGGKEFMFTRREGTNNPTDQGGASLIFAIAKKQ
jgi:hypothetical protein